MPLILSLQSLRGWPFLSSPFCSSSMHKWTHSTVLLHESPPCVPGLIPGCSHHFLGPGNRFTKSTQRQILWSSVCCLFETNTWLDCCILWVLPLFLVSQTGLAFSIKPKWLLFLFPTWLWKCWLASPCLTPWCNGALMVPLFYLEPGPTKCALDHKDNDAEHPFHRELVTI